MKAKPPPKLSKASHSRNTLMSEELISSRGSCYDGELLSVHAVQEGTSSVVTMASCSIHRHQVVLLSAIFCFSIPATTSEGLANGFFFCSFGLDKKNYWMTAGLSQVKTESN